MTIVELATAEQTREFGRRLAGLLRAGDLVILDGPLGAGKTALAQGIGAGLGVLGEVTSPTFVIARVHRPSDQGRGVPLVHVDAYRLRSLAEVDDLDLDTGLDQSVTVRVASTRTPDRPVDVGSMSATAAVTAGVAVSNTSTSTAAPTPVRRMPAVPAPARPSRIRSA